MSNRYEGQTCPVCHAKLFSEDDIVCCPTCGAPHHRECWKMVGHCMYEDKHGTPEQWTPTQKQEKDENNSTSNTNTKTCPTCGKSISSESLFCSYCGHDFISGNNNTNNHQYSPNMFNPFISTVDPLNGVSEDTLIDDEPVRKVARFVGSNSRRYIPIFARKNAKGKMPKLNWNWAAFLIPQYWMVFRKCYAASIFAFVSSIVSSLCIIPMSNFLSPIIEESANATGRVSYTQLYNIVSENMSSIPTKAKIFAAAAFAILVITRIVYALLGDYIYKTHCINKIKAIDTNDTPLPKEDMYRRLGNINPFSPVLAYTIVQMISFVISAFL